MGERRRYHKVHRASNCIMASSTSYTWLDLVMMVLVGNIGFLHFCIATNVLSIPIEHCSDTECFNSRSYSLHTFYSNQSKGISSHSRRFSLSSSMEATEAFFNYIVVDKNEHPDVAKQIYIRWINGELKPIKDLKKCTTLQDLKTGKHLLYLVNNIFSYAATSKPIVYDDPENNFHRILTILLKYKVKVKFKEDELIAGNSESILKMLAVIRDHQISLAAKSILNNMPQTIPILPASALLTWCQKSISTFPYHIRIENFRKDWKDGMAFSALLSKWSPDFSYREAENMVVEERLLKVLNYVSKKLSIEELFTVEEIMKEVVEEMYILLYIAKINLKVAPTLEQLGEIGLCDPTLLEFRSSFTANITEYSKWYLEMRRKFAETKRVTSLRHIMRIRLDFKNWISDIKSHQEVINEQRQKYNKYCSARNILNPEIDHLMNKWTGDFNSFTTHFDIRLNSFAGRSHGIFLTTFRRISDIIHDAQFHLMIIKNGTVISAYNVTESLQRINATIEAFKFVELRKIVQLFITDYCDYISPVIIDSIKLEFRKLEDEYLDLTVLMNEVYEWWLKVFRDKQKRLEIIAKIHYLITKIPNPSDKSALRERVKRIELLLKHFKTVDKEELKVIEKAKAFIDRIQKMLLKLLKFLTAVDVLEKLLQVTAEPNAIDSHELPEGLSKIKRRFEAAKELYEAITEESKNEGYEVIDEIQTKWEKIVKRWIYILRHSNYANLIYIKWTNWSLKSLDVYNMEYVHKIEDYKTGKSMCFLLRVLVDAGSHDDPICFHNNVPPKTYFKAVIKFLVDRNIVANSSIIQVDDLISGKKEALQNLLAIIRDFYIPLQLKSLTDVVVMSPELESPEDVFLLWCKKSAGQKVNISDFTSKSWSSGLALGAILSKWQLNFDYMTLLNMTVEQRFKNIFDYAKNELHIPRILQYRDFVSEKTEDRFIILYLVYLFKSVPHSSKDLASIGLEVDKKLSMFRDRFQNQRYAFKKWYDDINEPITKMVTVKNVEEIFQNYSKFQTWISEMQNYQKYLTTQKSEYTAYYADIQGFVNPEVDQLWNVWNMEFYEFQKQFHTYYNNFKDKSYKFVESVAETHRPDLQKIQGDLEVLEKHLDISNAENITQKLISEASSELDEIESSIKAVRDKLEESDAIVKKFVKKFQADWKKPFSNKDLDKVDDLSNAIYKVPSGLTDTRYELNEKLRKLKIKFREKEIKEETTSAIEVILTEMKRLIKHPPNPSIRNDLDLRCRIFKSNLATVEDRAKANEYTWFYNDILVVVNKVRDVIREPLKEMEKLFKDISSLEDEVYRVSADYLEKLIEKVSSSISSNDDMDFIHDKVSLCRKLYAVVKASCKKYNFEMDRGTQDRYDGLEGRYNWFLQHSRNSGGANLRLAAEKTKNSRRLGTGVSLNFDQFTDGKYLLDQVLDVFSTNTSINISDNPKSNFQNILAILSKNKVPNDIGINDLISGKISSIFKLSNVLQNYTMRQQVTMPTGIKDPRANGTTDPTKLLLLWTRKSVENAGVVVQNFNCSTWSDGFAFSAILARWNDEFHYGNIITLTFERRLEYVFKFIEDKLNVPQLLTVEELLNHSYDETTITFFVCQIFSSIRASHPNMWSDLGFGSTDRKLEDFRDRILNETRLHDEWYAATMRNVPDTNTFNNIDDIIKAGKKFNALTADIDDHNTSINSLQIMVTDYYNGIGKPINSNLLPLLKVWRKSFLKFHTKFARKFDNFLQNSFLFIKTLALQENVTISKMNEQLSAIVVTSQNVKRISKKLKVINEEISKVTIISTSKQFKTFLAAYREKYKAINIKIVERLLQDTLKLFLKLNVQINQKLSEVAETKTKISALHNFRKSTKALLLKSMNTSDARELTKRINLLMKKKSEAMKYLEDINSEDAIKVQEILMAVQEKILEYSKLKE